MLILVGVTISVALNGGLFSEAKKAAEGTETKRDEELKGEIEVDNKTYASVEDYLAGNEKLVGTYTTAEGTKYKIEENQITLEDGTKVDALPEVQDGDTYAYGDYEYKYNYEWESYDEWDSMYYYEGWGVRVLDYGKTEYGEILEQINGKNIVSLAYTFYGCENLTKAPYIPDTVENLNSAFEGCTQLTGTVNLEHLNNLKDMSSVFMNCTSIEGATFRTALGVVPDADYAFAGCTSLETVSGAIQSGSCYYMFGGCVSLKSAADIYIVDAFTLQYMFCDCTSLTEGPFILCCYTITGMFENCTSLTKAMISSDAHDIDGVFAGCESLEEIVLHSYYGDMYPENFAYFENLPAEITYY